MTCLTVAFAPSVVNGWWLRAFTDPFIEVDGMLVRGSWSMPTYLHTGPGAHRVRTFVRYRHVFEGDGGAGEAVIDVADDERVTVVARGGPLNQSPFMPTVVRRCRCRSAHSR